MMKEESSKREMIINRWDKALNNYIPNNKLYIKKKRQIKSRKLAYKSNNDILIFINIFDIILFNVIMFFDNANVLYWFFKIFLISNFGFFLKRKLDYIYNKPSLKKIAKAICNALKENKMMNSDAYVSIKKINYNYEIKLINADIRSQNLFLKCLSEATSRNPNSRYLLVVNKTVFNVPSLFDKNKNCAENFKKIYNKTNFAFRTKIVYSKNGLGKLEKLKLLLQNDIREKKDITDIMNGNIDIKWLSSALFLNNDLKLHSKKNNKEI